MNIRHLAMLTTAGVLASTLAMAQPSGQDQGTTSGPAAGSNVQPSAATQKKSRSHHHHSSKSGATAAGAPGVEAKPGSEGGPAPGAQATTDPSSTAIGAPGTPAKSGSESGPPPSGQPQPH